ncbi:MAG: hypothetical protein AAFR87_21385 [Bacteroidota bacterium]
MKIITTIICIIGLSFFHQEIQAQEAIDFKQEEIGLHINWRFTQFKDMRLSARTFQSGAWSYGTIYRKETNRKKEALIFTFSRMSTQEPKGLLKIRLISPQVQYSHQRKVGNLWVGGFIDSYSLLKFPQAPAGIFNNNPISYTITKSMGPMISSDFSLRETEDSRIFAIPSLQMGLFNYAIRPAYGHPYPDEYLNEEYFSPTRRGMAGPLLRSGKIKLPHKYQMIRFSFGLFYQIRSQYQVSLNYELYFQRDGGMHNSRTINHDLGLSATYLY